MLITKKNRIETNITRLHQFFEIITPSISFLQSDVLFHLRSQLKNSLTGLIYNESFEVLCDYNTRSINRYFKDWENDEDCTISVLDWIQPNIPLLIVPAEYQDKIPSVLLSEKVANLEDDLFAPSGEDSYIDFSYKNAEYHYAHYTLLNYVFNKFMNDILSSKYNTNKGAIFGDLYNNYFRKQVSFYKERMMKLALLSSNPDIQERAKMILTTSDFIYCEDSYTETHHCRVLFTSEYFVQGGDQLDRTAHMFKSSHRDNMLNEMRDIHNPLFNKYIDIMKARIANSNVDTNIHDENS